MLCHIDTYNQNTAVNNDHIWSSVELEKTREVYGEYEIPLRFS